MNNSYKTIAVLIIVASAILVLSNACIKGSGPIVQELIVVEPFTGVNLKGSFEVEVTLGSQQSVVAEGQQNIIDKIITNVNSDGVLELNLEKGNYKEFDLKIYVSVPIATYFSVTGSGNMLVMNGENITFDQLQFLITGSGNMTGVGKFNVDNLTNAEISGSGNMNFDFNSAQVMATLSGSGNMVFELLSSEMDAEITGSGNINCTGLATTQNLTISGSGDYKAFLTESQNTTIDLSGSGEVECKVNSQLNATISGSGNIYYKGTPVLNTTISGTGELIDSN